MSAESPETDLWACLLCPQRADIAEDRYHVRSCHDRARVPARFGRPV